MTDENCAGQPKGAVFISYSKEDVAWKDRLRRFLEPLHVWNETTIWADDCIDAGAEWFEAIKTAINESAVAVMLVTTDFLGTEFIAKEEVPDLLRLRRERGMWIIPVLVHHCPWESIRWLKQLNIVPDKATPLDDLPRKKQDAFLSEIANDIAKFLKTWQEPAEAVVAEAPVIEAPVSADIDISHLPETSAALFGRDAELDALDADWESPETRVVAFVAQGGVGKSALVNRWLRDLQAADWRGAERVFGWSFYSQGARDQGATAEMFIDTALRFFGDPDPEQGSAWDKGERLARLVATHRTLLVLDGMEPLQSLHDFERGRLRDPGLQALLRRLIRDSQGLCIISTRESLPDLAGRDGFRSKDLSTITLQDGRALLRSLRVVGTDAELEALADEFGPRALSVTLLGAWLYEQPGHAAGAAVNLPPGHDPLDRVLAGFEALLGEGPALDLLRMQGLFDRPAPATQVAAALAVEEIDAAAVERLRELRLLAPHSRHAPDVLEAHPLIREHYALELRDRFPDLFREAHQCLYEHLTETTKQRPDTLAGLQPLYQAVRHGCLAGMQVEAWRDVYRDRILRGEEAYSTHKLGVVGANLGAVACFFKEPWLSLSPSLSKPTQAWLLNEAAYFLRALGRLTDALEPMRVSMDMDIEREEWMGAAISASNLSELELTLGRVADSVADGERSVEFADRTGNASQRMINLTTHADALHQADRYEEALALFLEAEALQAEDQPEYPRLYSLRGFHYCDLLLAEVEIACSTASWRPAGEDHLKAVLQTVSERARQTLEWVTGRLGILDEALDHLSLARVNLYRAILFHSPLAACLSQLGEAVDGLRAAGQMHYLTFGLLTRAWARFAEGDEVGCREDLDEAWEIAERGPMKLYMADIQLYRARFFRDPEALKAAASLIAETGYHRRDEELAYAHEAAKSWEQSDRMIGLPASKRPAPSQTQMETRMKKTVVEFDLVGYSTICDNLEQALDVGTVAQLNQQIQDFIDVGLTEIGQTRDKTVATTTGDGAILVIDSPELAHRFASAVHEATRAHNAPRSQPLAKRIFRSGMATGDIVMKREPGGGFDMAGTTIARAVRLEAKAQPGGLLVDEETFEGLTAEQKGLYASKTRVAGKRDEVFDAYACQLNPEGPKDAAFFSGLTKDPVPSDLPVAPALAVWRKKLAFLQAEEARVSDAEQKFTIRESIEEAEAKIRELEDKAR